MSGPSGDFRRFTAALHTFTIFYRDEGGMSHLDIFAVFLSLCNCLYMFHFFHRPAYLNCFALFSSICVNYYINDKQSKLFAVFSCFCVQVHYTIIQLKVSNASIATLDLTAPYLRWCWYWNILVSVSTFTNEEIAKVQPKQSIFSPYLMVNEYTTSPAHQR